MPLNAMRRLARKGRTFELTWRYVFNLAPTLSYRLKRSRLTGERARVLADLNRNGVAVTSASELLGADSHFAELCAAFHEMQLSLSDRVSAARARAATSSRVGEKSFIFEYLGHNPVLNPGDIFVRFALSDAILGVANGYLGMHTRLRYCNVWHTFKTEAEARESQLWHRDREDRYIFKAFVYLSDVGAGAGPFTYAAGSHPKASLKQKPESFAEGGVARSSDAQMARVVPPERWTTGVGPKGTIIFADTRGYHKGGLTREQDRIMYTCMFTSPASESHEFFRRPETIRRPDDRALAFALAAPRRGPWLRAD